MWDKSHLPNKNNLMKNACDSANNGCHWKDDSIMLIMYEMKKKFAGLQLLTKISVAQCHYLHCSI